MGRHYKRSHSQYGIFLKRLDDFDTSYLIAELTSEVHLPLLPYLGRRKEHPRVKTLAEKMSMHLKLQDQKI